MWKGKKNGGGVRSGVGRSGCVRRIEVIHNCENAKKSGEGPVGVGGGGQGGCLQRIEVIVKMQNKSGGPVGGGGLRSGERGVRSGVGQGDVYKELKFL